MTEQSEKLTEAQKRILGFANGLGEIGYAAGGDDKDWPDLEDCEREGLIQFKESRGYKDLATNKYKSREIYEITDAGRAALKSSGGE